MSAHAHSQNQAPEKGLLSFIKTKLEHAVHPRDIKQMLMRAGFAEDRIDAAFMYVRKIHAEVHQDLAAVNNFLPPLSKHKKDVSGEKISHQRHHSLNVFGRDLSKIAAFSGHGHGDDTSAYKGLFAGRLRRKDFVIGFLFFFGVGYVLFAFSALLLSLFAPDLWQMILDTIAADTSNYLFMLVPVILAPITVMSLSLIARRLHNLGLPGGLAFLFLLWFLPSFGQVFEFGFLALEISLLILFVVLVTVKGSTEPNRYGPLPGSRGSFFRRIFNI